MTQLYVEQFDRFSRNGAGESPAWLAPLRKAGIERFAALGFPTQKNEDWHFTSLQELAASGFDLAGSATPGSATAYDIETLELGRASWPTLVFVNGVFSARLSSLSALPEGVEVMPLASAISGRPDITEPYLGKIAAFEEHSFTALNTAFIQDGAFVHIGAGHESTLPVRILYLTDRSAERRVVHPRTLIVAEPNSRITVIESFVGLGDAQYFNNAVCEVVVKSGATVNHHKLQQESGRAFHIGTSEARQERDSHYLSFSFATGAHLSRSNIYTLLDGEGAGATLNGLYMVDGTQHVDHQTRIEHAQPNCFSREVYKGILDGASHGVFNGKVYVHPIAQKTDGKQSNNNLLLSEKAHVDTKPQLEIFADDVKCTHGATVGRIDQVALFYMKSRGLNPRTARDLLTYAFAAEVLEQIDLSELREELESLTLRRFTTH